MEVGDGLRFACRCTLERTACQLEASKGKCEVAAMEAQPLAAGIENCMAASNDDKAKLSSSSAGRGEERQGGPDEDAQECGICLDNAVRVAVGGCGHLLCTACAVRLCCGDSVVPPACPFCRSTMGGFRDI